MVALKFTTSTRPGSQRAFSSNTVVSFVTSAQSESPVLYSSLTSKLPDLITLLALVTESVNHAAVVPTSKVP